MKLIALAAVLLLALTTFPVRAADTALETSMKQLAIAFKHLGTDLKMTDDTKHNKDSDLKDVSTMKTAAGNAQNLVPKKVKAMPADQQPTQVADYQKDMTAFTMDIDTINQDITAEKWDAARTDYTKLLDDEKSGHQKFRIQKNQSYQTITPATATPAAPTPPAPSAPAGN